MIQEEKALFPCQCSIIALDLFQTQSVFHSQRVSYFTLLSICTRLSLFLPSNIASVLYSRDVIQKKPGQLGSEMHACSLLRDLPNPGGCSHLPRLPCSQMVEES